jgi:hypothetical protein
MNKFLRFFLLLCFTAIFLSACGGASESLVQEEYVESNEEFEEEYFEPTAEPELVATELPVVAALPEPVSKDVYAFGDVAELEPFVIQVQAAEPQADWGEAKDGFHFVAFDVKLQNLAAEAQDVSLLLQFIVEDGAGTAYSVDPGASLGAVMSLNGRMDAGELGEGTVAFQVPDEAQDVKFVFRTIDLSTTAEAERVAYALE